MVKSLKIINLLVSFLLELGALAAFSYWGFKLGSEGIAKVAMTLGVPIVAALTWGTFAAPRAALRVRGWRYSVFAVGFFGLAVASLAATGQFALAILLGGVFISNHVLLYLWRQADWG